MRAITLNESIIKIDNYEEEKKKAFSSEEQRNETSIPLWQDWDLNEGAWHLHLHRGYLPTLRISPQRDLRWLSETPRWSLSLTRIRNNLKFIMQFTKPDGFIFLFFNSFHQGQVIGIPTRKIYNLGDALHSGNGLNVINDLGLLRARLFI